jgi:type IV pilus assembly protein PilV
MLRMQKKVDQKGFTLLELLIAVVLLAIGLLAVAAMQATAIQANSIGNKYTVVASLAQEVMEDILSWNPDPTKETRFGSDSANVVYDLDPNTAANTINLPGIGTCSATYSIDRDPLINGVNVPFFVKIDVVVTGGTGSGSSSSHLGNPVKTVSITSYKQLRVP